MKCLRFLLVLSSFFFSAQSWAQTKKIYLAPDDHTDFIWSATEHDSYAAFITQLDYFLGQIAITSSEAARTQAKFSTDGSLWLKTYRDGSSKVSPAVGPGANWSTLIARMQDGHIVSPLIPLVVTWGAVPAEGVLRSLYFPGHLERTHGVHFPVAQAMENMTLPLGVGSLFAGAGAKYFWHGVCDCATSITATTHTGSPYEVYRWTGQDGSSLLTKWYSFANNAGLGGYAEARELTNSVTTLTNDAAFTARHPWLTRGAFGYGWDDVYPTGTNYYTAMRNLALTDTDPSRVISLSNMTDYFQALETEVASATPLPSLSASFGNEWDVQCASLAQVSARVKRGIEKLRGAEALATLVSLQNPSFMNTGTRAADRETAFLNMGLYFEHDFVDYQFLNERRDWQRRLAQEIESYVDPLLSDAATQLGGMIQSAGANARFFVFNPLSWTRTDVADFPYSGASDVHVYDLTAGVDVPAQIVAVTMQKLNPPTASGQAASYSPVTTNCLRIVAQSVPSVGYRVYEIRAGASGTTFTNPLSSFGTNSARTVQNDEYSVTVNASGSIASLKDRTRANLEFVASSAGLKFNDLNSTGTASSGGSVVVTGNAGPVSLTLTATSTSPLAHTTSVTLYRGLRRVDIRNEVTANFDDAMRFWSYRTALANSPATRHEEVGAVLNAKLASAGGDYATANARYDFLTLNHFLTMTGTISGNAAGLTLSNADAFFFKLGNSTITALDTTMPTFHAMMGGRQNNGTGMASQAGDSYFEQRYAMQTHTAFDRVAAMKFSLEHQNVLVCGAVSGNSSSPYPASTYSYLTISDPNVLLWALKPHDDGIDKGIVARVWNHGSAASTFTLSAATGALANAKKVTHIETDVAALTLSSGALSDTLPALKMQTYVFNTGVVQVPTAAPTISPSGGTFNNSATVTLASATSGAAIHFTLDGTAPSSLDGLTYRAPFTVTQSRTVKAMAFALGLADSTVASATFTIVPAGTVLVGNSAVGNSWESITDASGAYPNAFRFTATAGGSAVAVRAYVSTIAGKYQCAIYGDSSGSPGALFGTSAEILAPANDGWQRFTLPTPVPIASGTNYWLAVWSNDGNANVRRVATGGTLKWHGPLAYSTGAWPEPFVVAGSSTSLGSIYAESGPPLSSFDQWKVSNGLAANTAASSDADGDGISLLVEYALALNPRQSNVAGGPVVSVNAPATALSFTYFRDRADLLYNVKTSTDLQTWTTSGVSQGSGINGQPNTATVPLGGDAKRFLRLEITQP